MKVDIGRYPKGDTPRRVKIVIDPYDTWSIENTLALIIGPKVKHLKDTTHGAKDIDE